MPAHDAVHPALLRLGGEDLLELADEGAGLFDLELDGLAQRGVGHAEPPADDVVVAVDFEERFVRDRAEHGQPLGVLDDQVVLVAVGDEELLAVGGGVLGVGLDVDPAEGHVDELPRGVVVVAGGVDDLGAARGVLEDAADDVVVLGRPVPAGPEPPAVDDVADEVELLTADLLQEARQVLGPSALGAQVRVADPHRSVFELHPAGPGGAGENQRPQTIVKLSGMKMSKRLEIGEACARNVMESMKP